MIKQLRGYNTNNRHIILIFLGLFIGLSLISLGLGGDVDFSWLELINGQGNSREIFWESRLPRTLSIILSAGAMGLAGLLMQITTQNPYAAPSTVGTVEAAQLGILLSLFIFPKASLGQKMLFAFGLSMLMTVVFTKFMDRFSFKERWILPLVGMIYGGMIGSLAKLLAYQFNLVQSMTSWLQASYAMIQTQQYEWLFLNSLMFIAVYVLAEGFSLMSLGQERSKLLGFPFKKMENLVLILVAMTTSTTMITVGGLPFLGVIIPNIIRRMVGDHLRKNHLLVSLAGMILVLFCDILARLVIRPYEVSVSLILGILGSIIFISILWRGEAS